MLSFHFFNFLHLAFVGDPLTYAQFAAKAAASGVEASGAAVAGRAVVGALASQFAAVAGSFLLGFGIGQAILKNLAPSNLPPELIDGVEGGSPGNQYVLTIKSDILPFGPVTQENTITGSFGAIVFRYTSPTGGVFEILTSGGRVPIFSNNVEDVRQAPVVISARRLDGNPEAFKRVPQINPSKPTTVPVIVPDVIPISPTIPDLPVFPEVYPIEPLQPGKEPEKAYPPGITVKIPETGDQYIFTPDTVYHSKYTPAPKVGLNPYVPPSNPTGKKPAETECPCPDESEANKEVLCRVKTLQDKLLDDGFTTELSFVPASPSIAVTITAKPFNILKLNVTQTPANVKVQNYPLPAVDVFYYGWYALLVDGEPFERMPLFATQMTVPIPVGVNGFMVACNTGTLCSAAYGKQTKKPYVDTCAT